MFPLYDETRKSRKFPIITISLIFLNSLIFFITIFNLEEAIKNYGLLPRAILEGKRLESLLTSLFLHGGIWHLLANMWFLWVFGESLESGLGHFKFSIFYLISGILSSLSFILLSPEKNLPLIGASGAISGVLGGYARIYPRNKIRTLVFLGFFLTVLSLPAFFFLFLWLFFQFFFPLPGVATLAHIAGFLIGFFLIKFFQAPKIIKIQV